MTKDEMKNKISMALKDPILQQGFEIICKELAELKRIIDNDVDKKIYVQLARKAQLADVQKDQLTKAKKIMKVAIEGIKYWGIVGGTERPFEKQAEKMFNLFLDKAEQFLKELEK